MLTQRELLQLTTEGFAGALRRAAVGATKAVLPITTGAVSSIYNTIRGDKKVDYNTPEKRKIVDILNKQGLTPADITPQTGGGITQTNPVTWSVYVTDTDGNKYTTPAIFKKNDAGQIELVKRPANRVKSPKTQPTADTQNQRDTLKQSQPKNIIPDVKDHDQYY